MYQRNKETQDLKVQLSFPLMVGGFRNHTLVVQCTFLVMVAGVYKSNIGGTVQFSCYGGRVLEIKHWWYSALFFLWWAGFRNQTLVIRDKDGMC